MHVAIGIEKDVVRLDISVNNVLTVDISQGTPQLGDPELNRLLGEGLSGNVESQVTAGHEVEYKVAIAAG
jgi:hypothetical protein